MRISSQSPQHQIPPNVPTPQRKSTPQADSFTPQSVRFSGNSPKNDAISEKDLQEQLPLAMRVALDSAKEIAYQVGSPIATPAHLLVAMLKLVRDNAASLENLKASTDKNTQALLELQKILFGEENLPQLPAPVQIHLINEALKSLKLPEKVASLPVNFDPTSIPTDGKLKEMFEDEITYPSERADDERSEILATAFGRIYRPMGTIMNGLLEDAKEIAKNPERLKKIPVDAVRLPDLIDEVRKPKPSKTLTASNAPTLKDVLKDQSPAMAEALKKATEIAKQYNSPEVEIRHLILAMLRIAEDIADREDAYVAPDKVNYPVNRHILDVLMPPPERFRMSPAEVQGHLKQAIDIMVSRLFHENSPFVEPVQKPELSQNLTELLYEALSVGGQDGKTTAVVARNLRKFADTGMISKQSEQGDLVGATLLQDLLQVTKSQNPHSKASRENSAPRKVEINKSQKQSKIKKYLSTPAECTQRLSEVRRTGNMTDEQYAGVQILIDKLKNTNPQSANGEVLLGRLNAILNDLPWEADDTDLDVRHVRDVLDRDHSGLEKPKREILRHISTLKRQKEKGLPATSKIICLVGPPGVGKTSISMAVAEATGRKQGRIALGGVDDEAEIRGHRSTYVGALPGRIVNALKLTGSQNPVLVLDEIDKLGKGKSDPSAALLEVLDPKQLHKFVDNYIGPEVPIDLSNVLFMVTANDLGKIPGPLRNRMEVIQLEAYDAEEKFDIAKKHLLPQIMKEKGLSETELQISDKTLRTLINDYHELEAGVRSLNRSLEKIAATVIEELELDGKIRGEIQPKDLVEILGHPNQLKSHKLPSMIGRVNGLAVMGGTMGEVLPINAKVLASETSDPKKPPVLTMPPPTGGVKEMMRESTLEAFHFVKFNRDALEKYGVELKNGHTYEVNISHDRISIPKDGDSAGAAFTTNLVSVLSNRKIRNDMAMTGTITIHGNVLGVGGVQQKLRGALKDNMKVVFLPRENMSDVEELPSKLKGQLQVVSSKELTAAKINTLKPGKMLVVPVDNITEILDHILLPKEASRKGTQNGSTKFAGTIQTPRRLNLVS